MTTSLYILYIVMFVLGQVLTIFWWDIPEVKRLAGMANQDFDWKKYWKKQWNMIIGLEVLGTMIFLSLNQILHWRPQLLNQLWWMSGVFGILGSGIGSRFGAYRKGLLNMLDRKANIADYGTPDKPKPADK